jgi:hypothetical protein
MALITVGAALFMAVSPAGAQIPDVPPLGFTIDQTEGPVGSEVTGTVTPADIEANCITDPTEFVAQFVNPTAPLEEPLTPYITALVEHLNGIPEIDLQNNPEHFALAVATFFPIGLALDLPANGGTGELAEGAVSQTFIMAFADAASASPIDPLGNFDRTTGEGSVEVPDLPPGNHPVITTCVGVPEDITIDRILTGVEAAAAFVEANLTAPYPTDILGEGATEFAAAAAQVAPIILREIVEPRALGIQFFCVHDATGACPGANPGPGPVTPPQAPPAAPVQGDPNFTG